MERQKKPSEELAAFLNFVDACAQEYQWACAGVSEEDKRLQDLLHAMEFAGDKAERNRVATKLQASRRQRRRMKDVIKRMSRLSSFSRIQRTGRH